MVKEKPRPRSRRPWGVPGGGVAMTSAKFEIETVPVNVTERVRAIRLRLPGQAVKERIEIAQATSGPLYTMGLLRERLAETLPTKIGYVRSTMIDPIEEYRG